MTTATNQLAALEACTNWLTANARLSDLRWTDELGCPVSVRPSDDLFMGADEATYGAWEAMDCDLQWCAILTAADELAEMAQLVAGIA